MGLAELLLLSVGLAMDAFTVSICKGLSLKKANIKEALICGVWFGGFQGMMPLIGYFAGYGFASFIGRFSKWICFAVFIILGLNMLKEALSKEETPEDGEECEKNADLSIKTMLAAAIATSIDALTIGITFIALPVAVLNSGDISNTVFAASVIAATTLVISGAGVFIGGFFGARFRRPALISGAVILILLAVKSLIF